MLPGYYVPCCDGTEIGYEARGLVRRRKRGEGEGKRKKGRCGRLPVFMDPLNDTRQVTACDPVNEN